MNPERFIFIFFLVLAPIVAVVLYLDERSRSPRSSPAVVAEPASIDSAGVLEVVLEHAPTDRIDADRTLRIMDDPHREKPGSVPFADAPPVGPTPLEQEVAQLLQADYFDRARSLIELHRNTQDLSPADDERLSDLVRRIKRSEQEAFSHIVNAIRARVRENDVIGAHQTLESFLTNTSSRRLVERAERLIPDGPLVYGLEMIEIPGGSYTVGTPADEFDRNPAYDIEPRRVSIDRFFVSTTEVTQDAFTRMIPREWSAYAGPRFPAHSVELGEAMEFCRKLTALHPTHAFSLPSEFEWEIACRAGQDPSRGPVAVETKFAERFLRSRDAAVFTMKKYGWFSANRTSSGPVKVGQREPNLLGLHDMHGNVSEWCLKDPSLSAWYSTRLGQYPTRGGSIQSKYTRCRAGARAMEQPGLKRASVGFRIIARPKAGHGTSAAGYPAGATAQD